MAQTISDKIGGPTDPKLELNPPLPPFQCCEAKTVILRELTFCFSMSLVVLLSKESNIGRGGGGVNKNFASLHKFIVINWVSHLLMSLVV